MTAIEPDLGEWRERAEFWASRDRHSGLYDKDAVAFANEVVLLLDLLRDAREERDDWKGQVVGVRIQQVSALRECEIWKSRAHRAESAVSEAHTYCARPEGVCLPIEPLPRPDDIRGKANGAS